MRHLSPKSYISFAPTTKPRHALTETAEVRAAIDAAARRWPEDKGRPSRLLKRLITKGRQSVETSEGSTQAVRRAALDRLSGAYTGMYEAGYLAELRQDWPE